MAYEIDRLLIKLYERRASELRILAGQAPRMYIGGNFVDAGPAPISAEDLETLIKSIVADEKLQELAATGQTRFWYQFGETGRLRVQLRTVDGRRTMIIRPN